MFTSSVIEIQAQILSIANRLKEMIVPTLRSTGVTQSQLLWAVLGHQLKDIN